MRPHKKGPNLTQGPTQSSTQLHLKSRGRRQRGRFLTAPLCGWPCGQEFLDESVSRHNEVMPACRTEPPRGW